MHAYKSVVADAYSLPEGEKEHVSNRANIRLMQPVSRKRRPLTSHSPFMTDSRGEWKTQRLWRPVHWKCDFLPLHKGTREKIIMFSRFIMHLLCWPQTVLLWIWDVHVFIWQSKDYFKDQYEQTCIKPTLYKFRQMYDFIYYYFCVFLLPYFPYFL